MSAHEVTFYQVKCDCCGVIETDYGDFAALTEYGHAREEAQNVGWFAIGAEDFCAECACWPEDLPDYPGDDKWEGDDDPVRKPDCHTKGAER